MDLNYRYNLTQEQKLILTQEMQLSIKILQMGIGELREYIDKEFQENPILEIKDNNCNEEKKIIDNKYDYKEFIKYLEFDNYGAESLSSYEGSEEISVFNFISKKKSLKEFLKEQLLELKVDIYLKAISEYIIESLDNRGYLQIELKEIAEELNVSVSECEKALKIVQGLEPYGIGARNLKECLFIQLEKLNLLDENLQFIINNSLEDIANNRFSNIAKNLNISVRRAQAYGDLIKKLEPKPSSGFYTGEEVKYIIPDAEIRNIGGINYILMNDSVLPKLTISGSYKEILESNSEKSSEEYIKDKMDKAIFLIKSINERRSTLYKILEKIIEKQEDYFEKGRSFLKPMTLKDIAIELDLHESTVSRAIKDKYILTVFGTVKIKDLFVTGLCSNNGKEEISVVNIKNKIKELINKEDKSKPISDQFICDELNKLSINISRRTVAKYREEMGIKSSSKRKRF